MKPDLTFFLSGTQRYSFLMRANACEPRNFLSVILSFARAVMHTSIGDRPPIKFEQLVKLKQADQPILNL